MFDYNSPTVVEDLRKAADQVNGQKERGRDTGPLYPYIIDCIGSLEGALIPITNLATKGTIVASLLPVIITHSSEPGREAEKRHLQHSAER